MHTEDEAKTKWCPFVRYATSEEDENASNRWRRAPEDIDSPPQILNPPACRCIGSACMAWRWAESATVREHKLGLAMPEGEGWRDEGLAWSSDAEREWSRSFPRLNRSGHCGLAGRPEVP